MFTVYLGTYKGFPFNVHFCCPKEYGKYPVEFVNNAKVKGYK